ncbi:hypothetical protein VCHA39P226_10103 [Vibrio chagasii]|nr:hypothetical protein VCHA39P226_10103 [Vibrio chagasii]CAH7064375.1 hypothetical protein VCHA52P456_10103 [Vibrio chagasii]
MCRLPRWHCRFYIHGLGKRGHVDEGDALAGRPMRNSEFVKRAEAAGKPVTSKSESKIYETGL